MNILWLTWKDRAHPQAGGAELVNEELAKRLVQDGHTVLFLTARFPGASVESERDGFFIRRLGGRFNVYWRAFLYYRKHLRGWPDLVIDEINTIPFFASFYTGVRTILFIHQLAREIWYYQMPYPISAIGYLLEPLYLRLLSRQHVITVSESTRHNLAQFGFKRSRIHVISEGIQLVPIESLEATKKQREPVMLSLGSVRPMKRTLDVVEAFEVAHTRLPSLHLIIAGDMSSEYGTRVRLRVEASPLHDRIELLGSITTEQKIELLRRSHLLIVPSIKEGWCLTVTEANSQGTPAVVYNADGLRDSVRHDDTGIVVSSNNPKALGHAAASLLLDHPRYERLRKNAWEWSKSITFERSYKDFLKAIKQ